MVSIKKSVLFLLALLITLLYLLFLPSDKLFAEPDVIIGPASGHLPLGKYVEILEDEGSKWTIDEIISEKLSTSFFKQEESFPGFGLSSSAYWVRFRVENRSKVGYDWYLEVSYPLIDRVDLYIANENGRIVDKRVSGDKFNFSERELEYRNIIFKIHEKGEGAHTYYVRFKTEGAMNAYLTMWHHEEFLKDIIQNNIIYGLYYGAMLIMLLYNLFIFLSTWDRSYIYYVFFCLSFIIYLSIMDGFAFQYIWPNSTWFENHSVPVFILLSLIFAIQFPRDFLFIKERYPKIDRSLIVIIIVCVILLPCSIFFEYRSILLISIILLIIMSVFLFTVSIFVLVSGHRSARFYVIAWSLLWIGVLIYSLKIFGILPDNIVTRWVLHSTSLLQLVLLSFGLADKINFMKKELEVMNLGLEKVVDDRTLEYIAAIKMMEKKEKELQVEFDLAGDIQRGILPQTPFYFEGIKVDAFYKSMGEVGGDFYDIVYLQGGYLGILIADASGHGMPAAFITALAKISFSEAVQKSLFPADVFRHVNNDLLNTVKTDDFVTGFFIVISPSYEIFYSNASHQRALVLRSNEARIDEWDTNGLFMGAMPVADLMYEDALDQLNYGDRLILHTDGFVDAKNINNETFNTERLKHLLLDTIDLSLEDARNKIVDSWSEFIEGTSQSDDVTMVIVEIDPAYKDLVEYREKGFNLLGKDKYEEAIAELAKALKINPADGKSHLYIGECYLKNRDFSKAVTHLREYLKNNEVDANVWYSLAQAHYNLGEYQMASKTSRRALQLKNDFIGAMEICGLSLKQIGESEEAKKIWKMIHAIDSKNEIAKNELDQVRDG